jgi:hypothetical protein
MKRIRLKLAAVLAALIVGLIIWVQPNGQAQGKGGTPPLSTNWVGCIVVGKAETGDPIGGRRPFPQADSEIQLGLRSDGVVVWQKARK